MLFSLSSIYHIQYVYAIPVFSNQQIALKPSELLEMK